MSVKNFLAACVLFVCAAAPAQALIVGAPGDPLTGNAFPFGVPSTNWGPEYQQVYSNVLFSGPMTIRSLRFYHKNYPFPGLDTLDSGTFVISLSTTSKIPNGLNHSNLADNIGADNSTVFTGSVPSSIAFGSFFDIFFDVGFHYDPSAGNLLLDVFSNNATGGHGVLDASSTFGNDSSRAYTTDPLGVDTPSYGLVSGFNEGQANPVPEPGTLTLMGFGLLAAAAARRRRS